MLTFKVLGPLEVVRDGRRLRLVGKPAALLVALLLRRNEAVSAERLVDELWDDRQPKSARKLLQAHVSELRKTLGRERVQTVGGGYLLVTGDDGLDLALFERLMREAASDPGSARRLLEDALALWRGPALADVQSEPFVEAAAARLEELRLHAIEALAQARLASGAGHELVPELETLVSEHPLRERLRGQLMLALYRSGRQADALDRYQRGRDVLVERLGLEPSPELRRLHESILRQDSSLDASPPPAPRASLVLSGDDENALALFAPVARLRGSEVLLIRAVEAVSALGVATEALGARREELGRRGVSARVASFRSEAPAADVVRFIERAGAELALVAVEPRQLRELGSVEPLLLGAACDIALLAPCAEGPGMGPVVVAFGGGDNEWAALEVGASLAQAHDVPLVLAGGKGRDADASRTLAAASLAVQRVVDIVASPLILADGPTSLVKAARGSTALLLGVPDDWRRRGLGEARIALAEAAPAPTLLVRRGLRAGQLDEAGVTRFTWSQ